MAYALAAAKLNSGGNEQAMTSMMNNAKQDAQVQREAAKARGAKTDEEAAHLAVAKAARDELTSQESILKDQGAEEILKIAFEDGSSVVCVRCGELIAKTRWNAHRDMWCPMIPDSDEEEKDK